MARPTTRLAAAALAALLPLSAVAACGAEKKRTVKAEFAAAGDNLKASKAASFTISLDDGKGALAALMKREDAPAGVAAALVGGEISVTVDPAGDKTIGEAQKTTPTDFDAALKAGNTAVVVRSDKAEVLQVRVVGGVVYATASLAEIQRLAEASGVEDFEEGLDSFGEEDERIATAIADLKAGKWLKLDTASITDTLDELTGGALNKAASPSAEATQLGEDLIAAVKPHVTVKDASDDSKNRVLDVSVEARGAVKSVLKVLRTTKALPVPGLSEMLAGVKDADIDEGLKAGTAKGTITLADGHLTQVAVDLESLRLLVDDDAKDAVAGSRFTLDVDDSADEVEAPTAVSSVDLGELFGEFFGAALGDVESMTGDSQMGFSYSG